MDRDVWMSWEDADGFPKAGKPKDFPVRRAAVPNSLTYWISVDNASPRLIQSSRAI